MVGPRSHIQGPVVLSTEQTQQKMVPLELTILSRHIVKIKTRSYANNVYELKNERMATKPYSRALYSTKKGKQPERKMRKNVTKAPSSLL